MREKRWWVPNWLWNLLTVNSSLEDAVDRRSWAYPYNPEETVFDQFLREHTRKDSGYYTK